MKDSYPKNWKEIALRIKEKNHWRCERCGHKHDPKAGYCLTTAHLVPIKSLVEEWNLAALCQRCHLKKHRSLDMFQMYMLEHSEWFKPHLEGFLDWYRRTKQKIEGNVLRIDLKTLGVKV